MLHMLLQKREKIFFLCVNEFRFNKFLTSIILQDLEESNYRTSRHTQSRAY